MSLFVSPGPSMRLVRAVARRVPVYAGLASLVSPGLVNAQAVPDAGAVRQQIEQQQRRNPLPPESAIEFAPPAPLKELGDGGTVSVKAFRFVGNALLSDEKLRPAVKEFIGRDLDLSGLQNAAIAVANAYRRAGWVVRAYLPEQDVTGGTITIQIIEGRFGAVRLQGENERISASRLTSFVESAQASGAPVNADALDRALLLISDLPGITARGQLSEGENPGETDLLLTADDNPMISAAVATDNAGARFTGTWRGALSMNLNSPLGIGDRVDTALLGSEGVRYISTAYSLPVGSSGWRVGANGSFLEYEIVTPEFEALDAEGNSTAFGLDASYPLIRSRDRNLFFSVNAEERRFINRSLGITTTRYKVRSASVALNANLFDRLGGGGANSLSLAIEHGDVDLSDSPNRVVDALTTRTAGDFQKARLSLSRLQAVTDRLSFYAGVTGQLATKNLDSSEKIYLGGSAGVRAYPENEAGGSDGMLLNLEARGRLPMNLIATAFFDLGAVRINRDNDFAGAPADNRQTLRGAGVSLGWLAPFGLNVRATWSHRLGDNPNPTFTGDDQDGSLIRNRVWLQASMML